MTPKKRIPPIQKELSLGYRFNTDGWGVFAEKGYVRSDEGRESDQFYNLRLFQLELDEHKHPKEVKSKLSDSQPGSESTRPFIYGKINNFYTLKLGYGVRRMIAGKPEPGTVSIHWVATGGFALGMEKPYYLDGYIMQDNPGALVPATFKYSEATKAFFLNPQYIRGRAGFGKGLDEISFVPGVHARAGLHFDFSSNRKNVLALEAGIAAEYYTRNIALMANQEAKPYFVNLYAALQFGRRW
ncbi:MAG: hypothetical protein JST06_11575 [Bacteroidetes bacterium]|nr:hypothetical protein [Bacteroidota bacterium]